MTTDNSESPWIQVIGRTPRVIPGTTHLAPPVPAWLYDYLVNAPRPKPVAKRRVLRKWSNRAVRLHRRINVMAQAGEDMGSARYWQLRGNIAGTRALQLGGSIRGRNNR